MLVFNMNNDKASLSLACDPIGYPHASIALCLLYSGSHFDVVTPVSPDLRCLIHDQGISTLVSKMCSEDLTGRAAATSEMHTDGGDLWTATHNRCQSACVLHSTLMQAVLKAEASYCRWAKKTKQRREAYDRVLTCQAPGCGASKVDMDIPWRLDKKGNRIGSLCRKHWLESLTNNKNNLVQVQQLRSIYQTLIKCKFCGANFAMALR